MQEALTWVSVGMGEVQAQGFIHLLQSPLLPRYPDKLLLPKFFLLATGFLCGFILLGSCTAKELPAE